MPEPRARPTSGPAEHSDEREPAGVHFTFDGRPRESRPGRSLAAALLANGERTLRSTRETGRPRGLFCGIGNCFDCLVDVDDEAAVRSCLRPVGEGEVVRRSASVGSVQIPPRPGGSGVRGGIGGDWTRPAPADPVDVPVEAVDAELLVLGAGPAGMAASLRAADLGCRVVLADAGRQLGGQIHRQTSRSEAGRAEPPDVTAGLPARFRRIAAHPSIRRMRQATAWAAERCPDGTFAVHVTTPEGAGLVRTRSVVVATGAAELSLPFPGWELPGVMTAGAAQSLVKADGVLPGRRVVVAGSGPFLLPAAAALAEAGATVVAVLEAGRAWDHRRLVPALARHPAKLREAASYLAVLARRRVPLHTGRAVVAALGRDQVERVQVARLDGSWRPRRHDRRELAVDAVCVSFGFVPALDVTRSLGCADVGRPDRPHAVAVVDEDGASTIPGVFLAGETTGIGGADVAELEGVVAGSSAAVFLGHAPPPGEAPVPPAVARRLRRARRFARELEAGYPLHPGWLTWLTPDTIVCRCEDVAWSDVRAALARGAGDLRAVKGLTRCGMGYCQGRTCGPPLQLAVAAHSGSPLSDVGDFHTRHIATPVTLSTLAGSAPPVG